MFNLTRDIYFTMGKSLMESDYYSLNTQAKKELISNKLKEYLITKITLANPKFTNFASSTLELFDYYASLIPKKEHENTIRHFIHFLLKIIGDMQNWEILWEASPNPEYLNNPEFSFNSNQKLNSLITYIAEDYTATFHSVYTYFQDYFFTSNIEPNLQITLKRES